MHQHGRLDSVARAAETGRNRTSGREMQGARASATTFYSFSPMRRAAGAHHGLSLANAPQLISASPTVGNAIQANDGAFTISFHVPAMRLVCRAPNIDVPCMHSQHTA